MRANLSDARYVGAFLTAAVGLINIGSALYPAIPSRMELLQDVLPLHVIRGSQTATVFVGFLLILLADGLRKRRKRAMQITVGLLFLAVLLNLAKGLDYEEALISGSLAAYLVAMRRSFDIPSQVAVPRQIAQYLATIGLLYYCYVLVGFIILRRVVTPPPSIRGATSEPFHLLLGAPHYHYLTPQAHWFARSLIVVGSVVVLASLVQLMRPLIPHRAASDDDVQQVRELIGRHGSDTLSYFSLQDGRSYFFHPSREAFLSYRLWGTVAIVGGDPIGPPHLVPELVEFFIQYAHTSGFQPCFLGVAAGSLQLYSERGMRTLKIGEEAIIDLPAFDQSVLKRKVRRAVRHTMDLGVETLNYRRADLPTHIETQMQEISREWVQAKGGTERGFSMTLGRLPTPADSDCEVTVAVKDDRVLGYLCTAPVYQSNGWSLDAMRRRANTPNGLMECLVVKTAENYRARGYKLLSLNFATLSNSEDDIESRALEGTRRFLFEQLSTFYQLKSLYQFNNKFLPQWHSRYLAYQDVLTFPKLAVAIVQSEDPVRIPSPASIFRR
jgi:lysylphosphatidylglycerol synthetase-like protein (DUF2156 family)